MAVRRGGCALGRRPGAEVAGGGGWGGRWAVGGGRRVCVRGRSSAATPGRLRRLPQAPCAPCERARPSRVAPLRRRPVLTLRECRRPLSGGGGAGPIRTQSIPSPRSRKRAAATTARRSRRSSTSAQRALRASPSRARPAHRSSWTFCTAWTIAYVVGDAGWGWPGGGRGWYLHVWPQTRHAWREG